MDTSGYALMKLDLMMDMLESKDGAKNRKRLYIHRKKGGFSCSGITAIGHNGMLYCALVLGKGTAEVYDSFLDQLAEELKNECPVVMIGFDHFISEIKICFFLNC